MQQFGHELQDRSYDCFCEHGFNQNTKVDGKEEHLGKLKKKMGK